MQIVNEPEQVQAKKKRVCWGAKGVDRCKCSICPLLLFPPFPTFLSGMVWLSVGLGQKETWAADQGRDENWGVVVPLAPFWLACWLTLIVSLPQATLPGGPSPAATKGTVQSPASRVPSLWPLDLGSKIISLYLTKWCFSILTNIP